MDSSKKGALYEIQDSPCPSPLRILTLHLIRPREQLQMRGGRLCPASRGTPLLLLFQRSYKPTLPVPSQALVKIFAWGIGTGGRCLSEGFFVYGKSCLAKP